MNSPFPKSSSSPGEGRIVVGLLPNHISTLETISYQYPLKLISPSPNRDQAGVLVFLLSYGGGLVGGDQVNLSVEVRSGAKLSIVTQGHTKIFQSVNSGMVTRQKLHVDLEKDAALCLLPDPVQPFESSVYEQVQIFNVAPGASMCLLDWVTHGRSARGENWSLTRWVGRNEIWASDIPKLSGPRLLVRDAIILDNQERSAQLQSLQESMYKHAIIGTLILRGPMMRGVGEFFLSEFAALPRLGARDFRSAEMREKEAATPQSPIESWRAARLAQEKEYNLLWSAANVRGCVIVKFGAGTVEAGRNWIGSMLLQEGSIERDFGEQAMICVR
ncbi:putative urease accessory protein [Rosellinia necatrix]|uniref:Putative urease accessory protein n=1 Tax=Rosellinia necatrix TaxID=77044 RepID=A0A1S7ULD0_ROSNE|nr:putative urease accessory protein [Rosellinia necatrix]